MVLRLPLFLLYLICLAALGHGPSMAQAQRKQQQAPTAGHPVLTPKTQKCPDFHGKFIYPGDMPVIVEQQVCSKLLFHHQDGSTATIILDAKPHRLQGETGQSIVRTSSWKGTTVHIDDKTYKDGKYVHRGIRDLGLDEEGNIILRTEMHAILDGQEFPEGNPIVNRAGHVSDSKP